MPVLTELSVDLAVKGFEAMKAKLKAAGGDADDMQAKYAKGLDRINAKAKDTESSWTRVGRGIQSITSAAQVGFGIASASILGFVRAGLQGTMQGELMQFQMQQLSREIAGVFLPTINKVNELLGRAVAWFQGLSKEQQDSVRKWVLVGVAVLGVVAALPKLVAAAKLAVSALSAMYANPVLAGLAAVAIAIGAIAIAAGRSIAEMRDLVKEAERFERGGVTEKEFYKSGLIDSITHGWDKRTGMTTERSDAEKLAKIEEARADLQERLAALRESKEATAVRQVKDSKWNILRGDNLGTIVGMGFNQLGGNVARMTGFDNGGMTNVESQIKQATDLRKELGRLSMLENSIKTGKELKFKEEEGRDSVTQSVPRQWQALGEAWRANQQRVLEQEMKRRGGKDITEQQLDAQNRTAKAAEETRDAVKNLKPAVVP